MTDITALKELKVAVEGGDRSASLKGTPLSGRGYLYQDSLNGSLDAAIQLLEAVLPGWKWHVFSGPPKATAFAQSMEFEENNNLNEFHMISSETPARALLLATIDALIAKGESE